MTWIDPREQYEPFVAKLSDGELCNLVAVISRRLCIPNWFDRLAAKITEQQITEGEWESFLEWVADNAADEVSGLFREWWADYAARDAEEEEDA